MGTTGPKTYVPEDVVVELIVASQGDHGAKSNADGVEHLGCSVHPHLPQG